MPLPPFLYDTMPLASATSPAILPASSAGESLVGRRKYPPPESSTPMTVAEARAILERHDWTQAAIAAAMGVHLRTAQRWFTESEQVPGPVAALLRVYDKHPTVRPPELRTS